MTFCKRLLLLKGVFSKILTKKVTLFVFTLGLVEQIVFRKGKDRGEAGVI